MGRIGILKLFKQSPINTFQICKYTSRTFKPPGFQGWSSRKKAYTIVAAISGGVATVMYTLEKTVSAYEWKAHPPHYPWSHDGIVASLDHAGIRRGWEVYKNVCAACHSLEWIPFRRLVDVSHTEEEAKAIALEFEITDGPDDNGDYFKRPGKLSDYVPKPYPNEEAAKAANNGAEPPDLSLIVLGRHGGEDYIFSLLTGYCEAPAGVDMPESGNYNPYFQGSVIAMPPPLYNGIFEYSDGTPATLSQLAKDICTFLTWTSMPEHDKRKLYVIKCNIFMAILCGFLYYINRHRWVSFKTRKVLFKDLRAKK